jgi:hypothetical protein
MIRNLAILSDEIAMNVRKLWSILLVVVLAMGAGFYVYEKNQPGSLMLRFEPFVSEEPLAFNEVRYRNPGGEGEFKIRDFRFFLSNIRLVGGPGEYRVPGSYHLARFDGENPHYRLELKGIPRMPYTAIQFGIGVDESANGSIASVGDLDPNSKMAWSWDVGYKFVLFEGGLQHDGMLRPLVYHVGFDENHKTVAFKLEQPLFGRRTESLAFKVDIMRLFTGANTIDMMTLSNVKFDRVDARLIADNYETMISMCASVDC